MSSRACAVVSRKASSEKSWSRKTFGKSPGEGRSNTWQVQTSFFFEFVVLI